MRSQPNPNIDAGLLALRLGVGANFMLLFALKQAQGGAVFAFHPGRVWMLAALVLGAALVTFGALTRFAAACMALGSLWALCSGLYAHEPFYLFPVRASLFTILFTALAFTGAGKFSLDRWRDQKTDLGSRR
jgi:uncharacterized membrane protein YphA (DoxX/SURF4 family)